MIKETVSDWNCPPPPLPEGQMEMNLFNTQSPI